MHTALGSLSDSSRRVSVGFWGKGEGGGHFGFSLKLCPRNLGCSSLAEPGTKPLPACSTRVALCPGRRRQDETEVPTHSDPAAEARAQQRTPTQVTSGGMLSSESELSSQPLPSRFICRSWSMVASTAPLLALKTHSMMS